MIIRKIKDEELKRTGQLFSVAFEFRSDKEDEAAEQMAERCRNRPESRHDVFAFERWAAFEDDDKTMMANFSGTPYDVEFDGSTVKMSGVGGVASLAQYRRHGAIRACFNKYLRDLYNDGFLFSTLYPFSTSYYRKFGYECGGGMLNYQISIGALPKYDVGGSVRLAEEGNCIEDIKQVFEGYRKGINLSAARGEIDYRWLMKENPAASGHYTYVYYNEEGIPKGVMGFTKEYVDDPPVKSNPRFQMNCQQFYFADIEGFKGLMNHCRAFEAYYDYVVFTLPDHLKMENYLPERALREPLRMRRGVNGMVRVINVKTALELARYRGDGELTVRVRDEILEENNGVFHVEFEEGRASAVTVGDENALDADLNITDFSRFLLGTHAPEDFSYVESAQFFASPEKLGKVFYRKPIHITESF